MTSPAVILSHRELISNLTQRDLKGRYKRSVLGWAWSLMNPAMSLAIYSLVFGVFFKVQAPIGANGTLKNFALYLFCGLVVWNAFSAALDGPLGAFSDTGQLLTKVYFPPELPALASVAGVAFQAAIEFGILVAFMLIVGNATWMMLLAPLVMLCAMGLGLGMGMAASVWNTRFRDVGYLITLMLQLMFYATPIVYRLDEINADVGPFTAQQILKLNPVTHYVQQMKLLMYEGQMPSVNSVAYGVAWAVGSVVLGWWYFSRTAPSVIEEL
jgi:ABC-type polysaccharide/polyol phosphate export permease